jgi:hypothetical protein
VAVSRGTSLPLRSLSISDPTLLSILFENALWSSQRRTVYQQCTEDLSSWKLEGLMFYATSYTDLFGRAAVYVNKILKGTKPADIPVEQPTKFEFIINLKAAKQIGLTIPPNVLASADRVIK